MPDWDYNMARRAITWDGVNLQDGTTYFATEFVHESVDNKNMNYQRLASRDGSKLVDFKYDPKRITIRGQIRGSSIDNLEANLDTARELFSRHGKDLDIEYASSTRRYRGDAVSFTVERRHFHLTSVNYEVQFLISNPPFGRSVDDATVSLLNQTGGTVESGVTFIGTAPSKPKIKIYIDSCTDLEKIVFTNTTTNESITIERTFTAAEELIIDTFDSSVTVDGSAVDYTGFFPDFIISTNQYKVVFTSSAHQADIKFVYYKYYL